MKINANIIGLLVVAIVLTSCVAANVRPRPDRLVEMATKMETVEFQNWLTEQRFRSVSQRRYSTLHKNGGQCLEKIRGGIVGGGGVSVVQVCFDTIGPPIVLSMHTHGHGWLEHHPNTGINPGFGASSYAGVSLATMKRLGGYDWSESSE